MADKEMQYNLRGVSTRKEDVYEATKNLDKGLFPNAFCKVLPDYLGNDEAYCNLVHADGSGTKSILAYLYWKEVDDPTVFTGIAQDALVMNLDDLLCAGSVGPYIYSSIINRNKHLIPGEILNYIIRGTVDFTDKMKEFGVYIHLAGGETADLGDIVQTITVDGTLTCRMKREDVLENKIEAGQVIIGLASSGQATYEEKYNSGIGSNGLTSARHDVLAKKFALEYPESYDKQTVFDYVYTGSKKMKDPFPDALADVGNLLLAPTRTYAPVVLELFKKYRQDIKAMIHCTGGAQTKVLHYAPENVRVVKDNMFDLPPVFRLIKSESDTDWKEMYEVFNMGHRLELYVSPDIADEIISCIKQFNIDAQVVGRVEASDKRFLSIESEYGVFEYV